MKRSCNSRVVQIFKFLKLLVEFLVLVIALCDVGTQVEKVLYFFHVQWNSFNLAADTPEIVILWQMRKRFLTPEVLQSVTSSMCTDYVAFSCVIYAFLSPLSHYNGFRRSQGG